VPAGAVRPGDRILVRPGDRVPVDGAVISGASEIDESLVTGETVHRVVASGATIYAGSRNFSGALTLRATVAGTGTLIDDVQRLLDRATAGKSRIVRLADRAAARYAPVVHLTAAATLVGWLVAGASAHDAVVTAIAVLIITCPCALALAIPAVQVVASGALFRGRVILSSGDAIERLAEVDTVVFDKTGTLTLPESRVENSSLIPPDLLERAGQLALSSHHPLAEAVAREVRQRFPYDGAVEVPGQGVRAMIDGAEARLGSPEFCGLALSPHEQDNGASTIAFSHRGRSTVFSIRQSLRPDAVTTVRSLAALGLNMQILSGDRAAAVAPIADALGISEWRSGLKPGDKIALIEAMKVNGRRVLMVGDGLNDAPSLAAAHVSLSPISASDLAQSHADALFLGERLHPVLECLTIARRARALMLQNLWLAVLYNAVAVPIAIAGHVTPLIAAAAMSGSSIVVTLNALRIRALARSGAAAARPAAELPAWRAA